MNEAEWLACTDPQRMFKWRQGGHPLMPHCPQPPISDRKLRLFACACLRLPRPFGTVDADLTKWDLLAVEAAEVLADDPWHQTAEAATLAGGKSGRQGVLWLSERNGEHAAREWTRCGGRTAAFVAAQAALLRDIIGNPFRPVTIQRGTSAVLTKVGGHYERGLDTPEPCWLIPTVLALTRTAYEERSGRVCGECGGSGLNIHVASSADRCPDCRGTGRVEDGTLDPLRLAVLSDALEEAGCQSEEILRHLRGSGQHVRGCWVLDLLLGKE